MTLNQQKIENFVIIASLKSETMGKLINRIPGSCLLISSLPCSASLAMSTSAGFKFNFFCNLLILASACISNSLNQNFYLLFLQKQNFMIFHQNTKYNSYSKAC